MNLSALTKSTLALIAFLTAVGGAVWGLGKPPFQNQQEADERYAGLQLQYYQSQDDYLARRIFDMEVKKKELGRNWQSFMENELQRLKDQRDRNKEQIKRYLK